MIYGDQVTIISPVLRMLMDVHSIAVLSTSEKVRLIRQVSPILGAELPDDVLSAIEQYAALPRRERRRNTVAVRTLRTLDEAFEPLAETVRGLWESAGGPDLAPALEAGLLVVDPILGPDAGSSLPGIVGATIGTSNSGGDWDRLIDVFVDRLQGILEGVEQYPLFDDEIARLVRAGVADGMFRTSPPAARRGGQAALASSLLGQLPTFPNASVSEILDIRNELSEPLVRFRAAVAEMRDGLHADPWDESFEIEANDLYVREVTPAIQEIQEAVRANAYLRQLAGIVLGGPTAATLTLGAVAMSAIPEIAVAGALPVAASAVRAKWEQAARSADIRAHKLYLLYDINRRLN